MDLSHALCFSHFAKRELGGGSIGGGLVRVARTSVGWRRIWTWRQGLKAGGWGVGGGDEDERS